jgi:perosamine synthetase
MDRIPIAGPSITDLEVRYVSDAAARCWYEHATEYVDRFERAFAHYVGVSYAVALPSCTSAIHLALSALGIGPGDEVIVPDVTWIATAAPVSYVGAIPCFADIDPQSWCLSVESVERCITPKTRAVIGVDLYGNLPDWTALQALCRRHRLALIEDAAEALGTRYDRIPAGAFGDIGVFSFHGTKTITTGEGGMLVTRRPDVHDRVRVLRNHGRHPGDPTFFNREVAFKYQMGSLQAALGLAQLERVEELVCRKREIMSWYRDELGHDPRLTLNPRLARVENSYWMVTALVSPHLKLTKERLIAKLSERGIDSRPFFYPLSQLPAYAGTEPARQAAARNPTAYRLTPYGINLPSALNLSRDQVAFVAAALREALDAAERQRNTADAA